MLHINNELKKYIMKQAVKTIVDSIEKEINTILNEGNIESNNYGVEQEFEYGTFNYDVSYNMKDNPFLDEWDVLFAEIEIEVKSVTVTNENSKVLTNLSTEVFNQLETTYTNY